MAKNFADDMTRRGLQLLGAFARSGLTDNPTIRHTAEKVLYEGTRAGFRLAGAMSRPFLAMSRLTEPLRPAKPTTKDLFDLTPSDEQEMMREAMGRFAEDRLRPAAAEADKQCKAPAELLAESADLGTALMYVPETLGGAGAERPIMTQVLVTEALARGDMGLAVACLAPAGVAAALSEWGTPEQQSTYLASFAGEKPPVASTAVAEPRVLFDPFKLESTARRETGGDYVLSGVKSLVPCVASGELFLVAAQAENGPGLFFVESGSAGLTLEAEPAMGIRASGTGRMRLDGVQVPARARLGGEAGLNYADFISRSRLAWCALSVGTAQAVLDYVIPYVNDRKAFGEPISNRQSVAFMISDIGIELAGMRLLTWRAAARADQDMSFVREAALARKACAEYGMRIGDAGVQLLGGHGYTKEHPVERWYRDLRGAGLMEGGLLL